jgi:hypothetical protein
LRPKTRLVVFTRPAFAALAVDAVQGWTQLTGTVGTRNVTPAVVRELRVGDIMLRNQPAVAVMRTETDAPEGDGLLPLHHFASVSFNASGYIVFQR